MQLVSQGTTLTTSETCLKCVYLEDTLSKGLYLNDSGLHVITADCSYPAYDYELSQQIKAWF